MDQLKSEREYTKQENKKTADALADAKKQLEIQELVSDQLIQYLLFFVSLELGFIKT